jgi:hypothetical protein
MLHIEKSSSIRTIIVLLGIVLIFALLRLASDYARALIRIEPQLKAWKASREALRMVRRNPGSSAKLFFIPLLIGGLVLGGLASVEWSLNATSAATILLVFLLSQLAIAFRSALRVGTWGAIVTFVDAAAERDRIVRPVIVMPLVEEEWEWVEVASPS